MASFFSQKEITSLSDPKPKLMTPSSKDKHPVDNILRGLDEQAEATFNEKHWQDLQAMLDQYELSPGESSSPNGEPAPKDPPFKGWFPGVTGIIFIVTITFIWPMWIMSATDKSDAESLEVMEAPIGSSIDEEKELVPNQDQSIELNRQQIAVPHDKNPGMETDFEDEFSDEVNLNQNEISTEKDQPIIIPEPGEQILQADTIAPKKKKHLLW
jgi:hypothetical protein